MIHIINLSHRTDRRKSVIEQMEWQKAAYTFWEGIMTPERKIGISRAHKQIIQYAKDNNLNSIVVCEDDIIFTHENSLRYYLDNTPVEYDIYLSSYYSGMADENFIIKKWSGMTMYCVHSRYFDTFLGVTEKQHIDTALGLVGGKFVVCPQFICHQSVGYSDQRKRFADDSKRLKNKPMYHG